jgi:hypothetical protein
MDEKKRDQGPGQVDTSGTHQPDPFARTRPDADAVGVPGETASGAAAGPAPDTPITTIAEDERGTQVEYARPASEQNGGPATDQTENGQARGGGGVKTGALTPAGTPRQPDRLEIEARIPRPSVTRED